MVLSYLLLATSVSIDSLGIGITYGLRNTKITSVAKVILFIISILITSFSVMIGTTLSVLFPESFINFMGCVFLLCMGLWVIYQALMRKNETTNELTFLSDEPKIHQFFIRFLGITIQIIRDPISSDFDHSKKIDWKEAFYLGIALSIDSLCVGICSTMLGPSSFLFPVFVATFQLIFLSIGSFLGKKVSSSSSLPENIWTVLSGVLLICIGLSRFFIG